MADVLQRRVVLAWALLVVATLGTWWLGTDHGGGDVRVQTSLVLVIAGVKMRLVGTHFMGLDTAPEGLRRTFDAWCGLVLAGTIGLYLVL